MAENEPTQSLQGEQAYVNDPDTLVVNFLTAFPPDPDNLSVAEGYFRGYPGDFEDVRDFETEETCRELCEKVDNPTAQLATMFRSGSGDLPASWTKDPEAMRLVLSVVGSMELGSLRARQLIKGDRTAAEYWGDGHEDLLPLVGERIDIISQFVDALQQKQPTV
ncbi:MAG: hypothetical protein WA843_00735 [Candidatus Saccharimonadales bacterium]